MCHFLVVTLYFFLRPFLIRDIPSFRDDEYRLAVLVPYWCKSKVNCSDCITSSEHILFIMCRLSLRSIPDRGLESIPDLGRVAPPIAVPEWASDDVLFPEPAEIQCCLIDLE